jgi:hypothetical protein
MRKHSRLCVCVRSALDKPFFGDQPESEAVSDLYSRRGEMPSSTGLLHLHPSTRFLTCNAELLALLSPQLDHELARRKAEQTVASRVKWVLIQLLGGHRTEITDVAKELDELSDFATAHWKKAPASATRQRDPPRTGKISARLRPAWSRRER